MDDRIEASNQRQDDKFCPVINASCRQDCICFEKATMYAEGISTKLTGFREACCSHVLICGTIYAEPYFTQIKKVLV